MKFEFDVTGLDKLQKELEQMIKNVEKLNGENKVSLDELFPDNFMRKYTDFDNIDDFEKKSKFNWKSIENIPDHELDVFVKENTTFNDWEEMLDTASQLWVDKKLDF